ncbi:MAG TPA: hypothetical protein VHF67_08440, partial [Gaiellaceae bacterium]|nr:hypothetical protein [Gaiellaceae bacterium]
MPAPHDRPARRPFGMSQLLEHCEALGRLAQGASAPARTRLETELGEEEVLACVVCPEPVSPAELARHCAALLPSFAVPRYVELMDELPL